MSSRFTLYRRSLKEKDSEQYVILRKNMRIDNQKRREEQRRKWREGMHTHAELEEYEAKKKAASERVHIGYHRLKAEKERQTRTSQQAAIPSVRTPNSGGERSKDMTLDEKREYYAAMRRKQRVNRSSQKKTADNIKQRKYHQERKRRQLGEQRKASVAQEVRLPKKAYNLNYEYKKKVKAMNLTNEQYSRTTLNLVNPRTPEKRVAVVTLQERHPCRVLFAPKDDFHFDVGEELGIHTEDEEIQWEAEECSNATHEAIQIFYHDERVSRLLPHA